MSRPARPARRSVPTAPRAALRRLLGVLRRAVFRARYVLVRRRLERTETVRVDGFVLRVDPTVFHPALFWSTRLLARYLAGRKLDGRRVLEMGTGSGLLALWAARQGAQVLAVDANPRAVACAAANAAANALAPRVRVLESDLFAGVPAGERFDLVLWNPPFYPEEPGDEAGLAWRAGEDYRVLDAFAAQVGAWLAPGAEVVLVLSSDVDLARLCGLFSGRGFAVERLQRRRGLFETLQVYRYRPG